MHPSYIPLENPIGIPQEEIPESLPWLSFPSHFPFPVWPHEKKRDVTLKMWAYGTSPSLAIWHVRTIHTTVHTFCSHLLYSGIPPNRIWVTVAYTQPLNYWLCYRPMILHSIVSQIDSGTVLESPVLWLEDHLFGFQGSSLPEGLPSVWSSTDERDYVQNRLPSFYCRFYRS